ncbi:DnaJ subfamily C member 3 [Vanrija pseudolonga]|uniref:Tetratricopeptide repeat and J domain-containing co-chaperone DNJ1 n=1 Tax=Vanrija pseudolonga TaxID=143232 RepID=A0AAF0Y0P5_9TREE|nr:DnaJ subfamily C member 3 [Vanrija pseudolonga]
MRVTLLSLPLALLFASQALAEGRTGTEAASEGNRLLAAGQYADAARAYGDAIEADPESYLNYYKRATAYLSQGRHGPALADFDASLRLNPGFAQAHYQKAKILAKEGDFAGAGSELKAFGKSKKGDVAADRLAAAVDTATKEENAAKSSAKKKQWTNCVVHAGKAIEVGPHSKELRELRAQCATELGDVEGAYSDLTRLATLDPASQTLPVRLAAIAFFVMNSDTYASHLKQCLHYDPDSKPCKKMHKLLRSLSKDSVKLNNLVEGGSNRKALLLARGEKGEDGLLVRFDNALKDQIKEGNIPAQFHALKTSVARMNLYALVCRAGVAANDLGAKTAEACNVILDMDPEDESGLVFKAEKLLKEEQFDQAVAVLQKAFEASGRQSQDIMNRLQKAQRLLKVSKQKDYYKVLDVPRDADERTIKKAFRRLAKKNHPDVGGSEEKMAQLNEAYEVLSDPKLREQYDNGHDPNDPTAGHGGGNPFAHHGGGFQFQGFPGGGFPGGFPGGGFPGGGGQKFHFQFQ